MGKRGNWVNGLRKLDSDVLDELERSIAEIRERIPKAYVDARTSRAIHSRINKMFDERVHESNHIPSEYDKYLHRHWRASFSGHNASRVVAPNFLTLFLISPLMSKAAYRRLCVALNAMAEFAVDGVDANDRKGLLPGLERALDDFLEFRPARRKSAGRSSEDREIEDAVEQFQNDSVVKRVAKERIMNQFQKITEPHFERIWGRVKRRRSRHKEKR